MACLEMVERRFRAMGSDAHVLVVGPADRAGRLADDARRQIDRLEARWSRFRPDSEVSAINLGGYAADNRGSCAGGDRREVEVSEPTLTLVERAVEAWWRTDGSFDPTMLAALVAAGYDRDFDANFGGGLDAGSRRDIVVTIPGLPADRSGGGSPVADIVVDRSAGTVSLPDGVAFDPGGLGKGLAADRVVERLVALGADGAMVNLGGDLRCAGRPPSGDAWVVGIPFDRAGDAEPLGTARSADQGSMTVHLADGGVATSTCLRRRWSGPTGDAHHLIDPATGRPALGAARQVSVVAANACDAEIVATSLAVAGDLPRSADQLRMLGRAAALILRADGTTVAHGPMGDYLR